MKNIFQVFIGYLVDKGQPTETVQISSFYSAFMSGMVLTVSLDVFQCYMAAMCVWFGFVFLISVFVCRWPNSSVATQLFY